MLETALNEFKAQLPNDSKKLANLVNETIEKAKSVIRSHSYKEKTCKTSDGKSAGVDSSSGKMQTRTLAVVLSNHNGGKSEFINSKSLRKRPRRK